jgi:hypothetical protein
MSETPPISYGFCPPTATGDTSARRSARGTSRWATSAKSRGPRMSLDILASCCPLGDRARIPESSPQPWSR